MTKLVLTALTLSLALNLSQAKTSAVGQVPGFQKRSGLTNRTLTKNVLVLAIPKAQRRLLVTDDLSDGDDGPPGSDELDLHLAYRRPELVKGHVIDPDISDYVKTRLLIARVRALQKYQETWA